MSRGLVAGTLVLAAMAGVLLGWELWTDSYIPPEQLARTMALVVFLTIAGGLAWLTRE